MVPTPRTATWTGDAVERSTSPGAMGREKRMSWAACTTWAKASGGVTRPAAAVMASHTGTMAKTGGASSPPVWRGLVSLVAAA